MDVMLEGVLKDHFPPSEALRVEDWAASDALAASELAVRLLEAYPSAQILASDHILYLIEAQCESGDLLIMEPTGNPLQYVRGAFVVSLCSDERWIYPINRLYRWLGTQQYCKFSDAANAGDLKALECASEIDLNGWNVKKINLIHPVVENLCKLEARFQLELHDAFVASRHKCHVVRVMNLYNPRVLGERAVVVGAHAVFNSLHEGGIAVIGRSYDQEGGANHATLLRRWRSKLVLVGRIGGGSEIESLFTRQEFAPIA